jgi:hypothetical protein
VTVILDRESVIGAKVEVTEGTAETLSASDCAVLVYDAKFSPDQARYKRAPARPRLTPLAAIHGRRLGRITFRSEIKGSGAVATKPEWDVLARACGLDVTAISTIAIGAIASGPFQGGETITGGTSSATGRVVGDHANGVSTLRFVVLTGVFVSGEVVTGGTSGATATTGGTPTASQGWEYRPISSDPPSVTIGLYQDGKRHLLVGARGTVKIEKRVGEPGFFSWEFLGVWESTTDVALPSPTYQEITPPAWQGVGFKIGSFSPILSAFSFDLGNVLEPRPSANATNGVLSIVRPTREATGEIDPEDNLASEQDWYALLRNGTTARISYEYGSGTGKRLTFAFPTVQNSGTEQESRNGHVVLKVPVEFVSATITGGDDEIQIGVY